MVGDVSEVDRCYSLAKEPALAAGCMCSRLTVTANSRPHSARNVAGQGCFTDPLSVSVTAERLLFRSKEELDRGDHSLSIVIAVMAVESYLTRVFLKLKGMANYATTFELPTKEQEAEWEKEYPRGGGFPKPIAFVSQKLLATTFDRFVEENSTAKAIFIGLPDASNAHPTNYFQGELFNRRNRIVHWGYVNSSVADAEPCHKIAVALVSILREMDRAKYGNL
jgi:hypothetical protein